MDDIHEMQAYSEGSITVWNCPICGRKETTLLGWPTVLDDGDASVRHEKTGPVFQQDQDDSPFAQWLEGVDFDAPLIDDGD